MKKPAKATRVVCRLKLAPFFWAVYSGSLAVYPARSPIFLQMGCLQSPFQPCTDKQFCRETQGTRHRSNFRTFVTQPRGTLSSFSIDWNKYESKTLKVRKCFDSTLALIQSSVSHRSADLAHSLRRKCSSCSRFWSNDWRSFELRTSNRSAVC